MKKNQILPFGALLLFWTFQASAQTSFLDNELETPSLVITFHHMVGGADIPVPEEIFVDSARLVDRTNAVIRSKNAANGNLDSQYAACVASGFLSMTSDAFGVVFPAGSPEATAFTEASNRLSVDIGNQVTPEMYQRIAVKYARIKGLLVSDQTRALLWCQEVEKAHQRCEEEK